VKSEWANISDTIRNQIQETEKLLKMIYFVYMYAYMYMYTCICIHLNELMYFIFYNFFLFLKDSYTVSNYVTKRMSYTTFKIRRINTIRCAARFTYMLIIDIIDKCSRCYKFLYI